MKIPGMVPDIRNPVLSITADEKWGISQDTIESFEFAADETMALPRCVIRFTDTDDKRLSNLAGLGIGSPVSFTISEGDGDNKKVMLEKLTPGVTSQELTPLSIAKVHSSGRAAGISNFELLLEHPWKIFKDFSSHAYAGKANSEIIKDLIEGAEGRGFDFEDIDKEQFFDSDEDGKTPRYKCGEGDLDFITKHLIPYTTINKNPAVFWVDELNCIHLDTFQNMYKNDAKVLVVMGGPEDLDDTAEGMMTSMDGVAYASDRIVKIGSDNAEDIVSILKPNVSIDDVSHMISYTGHLLPKIAIGKLKKGLSDKAHVPVMLKQMAVSDATDKKIYRNHPLSDLKAVALHEQELFNSMFTIEINTSFCGHLIHTGQNVEFYVKPDTSEVPPAKSWMNGKWHVRGIKYYWEKGGVLKNKLILIRPSFDLNKLTTSIFNIDDYYAVGMAGL